MGGRFFLLEIQTQFDSGGDKVASGGIGERNRFRFARGKDIFRNRYTCLLELGLSRESESRIRIELATVAEIESRIKSAEVTLA